MRAAYYESQGTARDVLRVGELPAPSPGPGEVLVRVHASGVNPSDVKTRAGSRGGLPAPRIIPHNDGAGVIEAVGSGVDRRRIGERVWLYNVNRDWTDGRRQGPVGTAAELVALPAPLAVPLPDGVSIEAGAGLGVPAMTAHRAVFADGPVEGQAVLVTGGAGAVGLFGVQFARWGKAARVIATVSSEEKAAVARAAGADTVLNYRTEDVGAAVMELTRGQGIDRIVEVDLGGNLARSMAMLKPGTVIASYASSAEPRPAIDYYALMLNNVLLRQVHVYSMGQAALAQASADTNRLLESGMAYHLADRTFPLDRMVEAHERVEAGPLGKVVVTVACGAA